MIFLETARLRIRNVEPLDADEIFDYRNNELCAKFQRDQTRDRDGIVALIEKRKDDVISTDGPAMLAVALKDNDKIIGEIVIMPCDGTISLGYTFSYKIHRRGYAYEALSALIDRLHSEFTEWDYISFTDVDNIASRKLLEKLEYEDLGYLASKDSEVYGRWLRPDTIEEIGEAVKR